MNSDLPTEMASCYHTLFFTTSPKAKFPKTIHLPFAPENGAELGQTLVSRAVENFARRRPEMVFIPVAPAAQISGFSVEVIQEALGGTWEPLLNAIKAGQIRVRWGWWVATTPRSPRTTVMST